MMHYVFSLLLTTIAVNASLAQEPVTTVWAGTLDARGTELRLEVTITQNTDQWEGKLRSLDQNDAILELDDIEHTQEKLSFSIPRLRATFDGQLEDDGLVASGTFNQSGIDLPLKLSQSDPQPTTKAKNPSETLKEAWVGELDMGIMKPVMQFRIVTAEDGESKAYFDSVTEGATGFEATWSIVDDKIEFDVRKIRLTYRGTLDDSGETAEGTWTQGGRKLPLKLKKQQTPYNDQNVWENRPQRPQQPFPYDVEDITFENSVAGITLAGTLTLPKTAGKHPAVVLISGSGPQDRDETLMEHKPFLVIADYLTRRGIAVLRFDDRGTAKSTGTFAGATTRDFATDASAAVDFLLTHPRINSSEIGLAGHSEGGLIAPMVCGLRNDVAFVVLLAATGVDGKTIIISQTKAMLKAERPDESDAAELEFAGKINELVIGKAVQGDLDFDHPDFKAKVEEMILSMPEEDQGEIRDNIFAGLKSQKKRLTGNWMKAFLAYDPRPALKAIQCPTLAIIGSKDLQVLPELNMPEIEKALTEGGNTDFELVTFPGLNHLFQECELGTMTEYASIQETFNPKALKKMGDWIAQRTTIVK